MHTHTHKGIYIFSFKKYSEWETRNWSALSYAELIGFLLIFIALDKVLFSTKKYLYFSYYSTKIYVVGTHQKRLAEALLMSTHNICFC